MADANPFAGAFDALAPKAPAPPPVLFNPNQDPNQANPFAGAFDNLDKTDKVGAPAIQTPQSRFSQMQDLQASDAAAKQKSDEMNSFWSTVGRTLYGLVPGSSGHGLKSEADFQLSQALASDPKEFARQAALGLANGITLGGTDFLQRKAFEAAATKNGMSEEDAAGAAKTLLQPSDPGLSAVRGGFDIAGSAVPYMATDGALGAGLKYAAPGFVSQYGRAAKLLTDIGAFNTAGQINESFLPADEQNRVGRALADTTAAGLFNVGGLVWRGIKPTVFGKPAGAVEDAAGGVNRTVPVGSSDPLVPTGETQSADALQSAADQQIKTLEEKGTLSSGEQATLKFLRDNRENPEALFKYNQAPAAQETPVPDAKTAVNVTMEDGKKMNVATNNLDSLQSYIKGSGDINYKTVSTLGKDVEGNPINARHEFNPTTGEHTIYVTNATDAASLAHELGHYFDTSLTKDTSGLAKLLPDYAGNQSKIEDTLASVAVQNLGGNASKDAISAEIKNISASLEKEITALSAARDAAQTNPSEQFANAVSKVLTEPGASEQAPTLMKVLQNMEKYQQLDALGKETSSIIKRAGEAEKMPMLTAKEPNSGYISVYRGGDTKIDVGRGADHGISVALERDTAKNFTPPEGGVVSKAYLPKSANILREGEIPKNLQDAYISEAKKLEDPNNFSQALQDSVRSKQRAIIDYARSKGYDAVEFPFEKEIRVIKPNVLKTAKDIGSETGKGGRKPLNLPRTPTGHQPDTPAFRAEKITTDQDLETFMNTKILPKITGEERIGKTNEDILTRSFGSDMTEKKFDSILTERFGNMSEDIVAAKRLMTDKATALADALKGKDLSMLTAKEMGDVMTQYQQTIEMYETFSGMRTELSNAFRSLGIAVNRGQNDALRAALEGIQETVGDQRDPFKIIQALSNARQKGPVEYYFEVWYPSLLSGYKTSARNITGNASNLVADTLSALFTKEGRKEFIPRVMEIVRANKEGLNIASRVMKGEHFSYGKFYEVPVPDEKLFTGKWAFMNKIEYVGRFLNAQDAYFSNAFKRAEVAAQRTGDYTYGLENKQAIESLNDAVGTAAAARGTFRNKYEKTIVGDVATAITSLKQGKATAGTKVFGNFIFPFIRTIANITDRQIDYLPIANISRTFFAKDLYEQRASRIMADADIAGFLKKDAIDNGMTLGQAARYADQETARVKDIVVERLRHQQMGKFYMGLTATTALVPYAMSGSISGSGPSGKNAREVLQQSGWRPNSIKIGGVWFPYQNTALPMAAILSAVGNVSDAIQYGKAGKSLGSRALAGAVGFANSEVQQSFLSGLGNIWKTLAGDMTPEQYFSQFTADAIPVPAMWTQLKDTIAPARYTTTSDSLIGQIGDQFSMKLGFTSNIFTGTKLQPKLDAFGNQVNTDLIYGLTPGQGKPNDPVIKFMVNHDAFVGKPQPSTQIVSADGTKRKISPEEYTKYVRGSGQALYNDLRDKIEGGYFNGMTDDAIRKEVTNIAKTYRADYKSQIPF